MSMVTDESDRGAAPAELLLVEDNPGDVRLVREALRERRSSATLQVVADGEQAIDYLRRRGAHSDAVRPDLVLLDLNLPRKSGREVLAEIKGDPGLRRIPVVVLTSSTSETEIAAAYDLNANCYCAKPVQLEDFIDLVGSIESFWLTRVTLPPR
jgi:CheY-like chemotaxis protein